MSDFKILFYHIGHSDYVPVTTKLAKERNPGADVVLITDVPGKYDIDGVEVVDWKRYNGTALKLDKIYQHKNTCPRYFNLRGIQRWLVFQEYREENLKECGTIFVADSDVMIFSDLQDVAIKRGYYDWCDCTLSMGTAGGQSYWFHDDALDSLSVLIWGCYANPDSKESKEIFGHYDKLQAQGKPGGVCDMTILDYFRRNSWVECADTNEISSVDNAVFDHNFLMAQGYDFVNTHKDVIFHDGIPYVKKEGEKVRFHTLHLSGHKNLIEPYYKESNK